MVWVSAEKDDQNVEGIRNFSYERRLKLLILYYINMTRSVKSRSDEVILKLHVFGVNQLSNARYMQLQNNLITSIFNTPGHINIHFYTVYFPWMYDQKETYYFIYP